ncbi:MAG TPA: calcium-binding protein [Tepidisphaeraceae bacterium]|jgi:hypothetical protein
MAEAFEPRTLFAFAPFGPPQVASFFGVDNVDALAGNAAGTHVVAWVSAGNAFLQVYDAGGVEVGQQLLVNNVGGATSVDVAINAAGEIAVAYAATEPGGIGGPFDNPNPDTQGVYVRRFDATGNALGAPVLANTIPDGDQVSPRVGIAADNSFVVVWQDNDDGTIKQRRFDAAIAPITPEQELLATGVRPDIAVQGTGGYVLAYTTNINTIVQRYTAAGVASGVALTVDDAGASNPSVGVATDGSFVVAYERAETTGTDSDVVFQRFSPTNTLVGGITNASSDPEGDERLPQVDVSGTGQFAVGWIQGTADGVFDQIGFRAFDNTADEITDDTIINDTLVGTNQRFGIVFRDNQPVRVGYRDENTRAVVQTYVIPAILTLNLGNNGGTLTIDGTTTNLVVRLNGTSTTYGLAEYTQFIINGGDGPDFIRVRNAPQPASVTGGGGDDTIRTAEGNDTIDAGDGSDAVAMGDGDDYVYGGTGNDTLFGGAGRDSLTAGPGRNLVYGENDPDLLQGGNRPDTMYGGAQSDRIFGRAGGDGLFGQNGDDSLFGGTGNDGLVGGLGTDSMDGAEGADTLRGGIGSDNLLGGPDNDLLYGDTGSDALNGGLNFDTGYADVLDTLFAIERRRLQR